MTTQRDQAINDIAREALGLQTLETRRSDRLDFHDLAVWTIKDALERAYEAGRTAAPPAPPTRCTCPACGRRIDIVPITKTP